MCCCFYTNLRLNLLSAVASHAMKSSIICIFSEVQKATKVNSDFFEMLNRFCFTKYSSLYVNDSKNS